MSSLIGASERPRTSGGAGATAVARSGRRLAGPSSRRLACRWPLVVLGLLCFAGKPGWANSIPEVADLSEPDPYTIVQEGISVRLEMEHVAPDAGPGLREEDDILFRFTIEDTATGLPLSGLFPAAWMDLIDSQRPADPRLCNERVEEFASGSILTRAELDLNVYYVLALNHDSTISVVDPLFGYGGTKLLALIPLASPGNDWVASPEGRRIFVSLPDSDRLAVVDTASWTVTSELDIGSRPTEVALQPDGAYLWVALEGDPETAEGSGVAVVDTRSLQVVARLATGAGPHEIAFRPDSRFAWMTNGGDDSVSQIDVRTLTQVRRLETGDGPASIAYSRRAGAVYVTHTVDGYVVAIDGQSGEITSRIRSLPGLGQIRFVPGSRLGLAVNPRADTLIVIDTASNRIVQTGEMKRGPDQIAFTDDLAYIRHRGSEIVLMIPLDEIGEAGTVVPVIDFPGGQEAFGRAVRASRAPAIVRAPGAVAVLVANPADQVIYYYKEGMAAPMGAFKNYGREPLAALAIDRSLGERSRQGVYETAAKLRSPGRYEIAFYLETPRIVHCFAAEVESNPERDAERLAAMPLQVESLIDAQEVTRGTTLRARFRLVDPVTGSPSAGLEDVRILAYSNANWQRRQWAEETSPGIYESSFTFPDAGTYYLSIEAPSGRLPMHRSLRTSIRVAAE
ncbi:MAG: YncE family protein [Acidobacteriota bacterium]